MVKSFHQRVDDGIGVFSALSGQMKVGHGGLQIGVAHVALDHSGIGARFQQMGRVAVTQGVYRHPAFFDRGGKACLTKSALDAFDGHGGF